MTLDSPSPTTDTRTVSKRLLLLVGLLTVFLFLFRLGTEAFIDYDEATYTQVVKETIVSGHLLPLVLDDKPWVDKPPLYFFLATGSGYLFGFNEFALRFPSALLGILSIFLTYAITRQLKGGQITALLAGGILLTTSIFLEAGRQVRLDVPVTAFLLLAFFAFLKGSKNPRWYLLVGIATVLGFLTKSVIIFLIAPTILLYSFFYKQTAWIKNSYFWIGWLLGATILVPWIAHEYVRDPALFSDTYLRKHLTQRVSERVIGGTVSNSFYITYLFRFVEPWFPVFISVCIFLALQFRKGVRHTVDSFHKLLFPTTTAIVCFLPFAVAQTKLFYYLTPLYPFMAVACAFAITKLWYSQTMRLERAVVTGAVVALFVVGMVTTVFTGFHIQNAVGSTAISEEERAVGYTLATYPPEVPVYAVQLLFCDTIRYYADKKVTLLPEKKKLPEAFLVVVPTSVLTYGLPEEINALSSKKLVYKGTLLSILYVP
ncbi:MAG: glycosyltransferase family 39 protein [Candidatus Taylorbacteria bacterium]|nr:glycosyltransferase family 39 protein [Candidatus Taylorbacteria bacterium]